MFKAFGALAFCAMALSGCAAMQDIANIIGGNSSQKITRTPIWVYRPDLRIIVDGATFDGIGVTTIPDQETDIQVQSQIDIDRVEISTCSRHDVCQVKGGDLACDPSRFLVERSFFGNAGKFMTYHFSPDKKERDDSCANLMIAIYDKNVLAAWGYVHFRTNPEMNFPAHFTCNAADWKFQGASVCAAKAGTIQDVTFDDPIADYDADPICGIKKVSDKEFEFKMTTYGWCTASFRFDSPKGPRIHDVIMNGYDETLLRDGQE
jgi:hypothetical protein